MKTAFLISGDPRFCADFDIQIKNLTGSEIDWYVVFWKKDHSFTGEPGSLDEKWSNMISPLWKHDYNLDDARNIIESRLPAGHRLMSIRLEDYNSWIPDTSHYRNMHCEITPALAQWYLVKKCWDSLEESGNHYDLIMRSRPDIGLSPSIDLQLMYNTLLSRPNTIISEFRTPTRCVNEWAIGLPNAMKTFCDAINHIDHFNINLGFDFDPEQIVFEIWKHHGLVFTYEHGIHHTIRSIGSGIMHSSNWVPNFGNWG